MRSAIALLTYPVTADYEMLLQLDQPSEQGTQQSTASEDQLASVPSFTFHQVVHALHNLACFTNYNLGCLAASSSVSLDHYRYMLAMLET